MGLNLTRNYSINFSLPKRQKKLIKFIIIHYTGMKSETSAIKKLIKSSSKVSSHYFIKNNGQIISMVPDMYEAWHAGKSSWGKYSLLNKYSIGIEINNPGHQHGYTQFRLNQIISLKKLLKFLIKKYDIKKWPHGDVVRSLLHLDEGRINTATNINHMLQRSWSREKIKARFFNIISRKNLFNLQKNLINDAFFSIKVKFCSVTSGKTKETWS